MLPWLLIEIKLLSIKITNRNIKNYKQRKITKT